MRLLIRFYASQILSWDKRREESMERSRSGAKL
jgi:hypothetical protein